jgi:hypothetical protein
MQRLIARLLLFFAVAGNLTPLALAVATPQPHACCVRKTAHPCHGSAESETDQLTIRAASCCDHDCCRAVAPARWAYTRGQAPAFVANVVAERAPESYPNPPAPAFPDLHSSRAPPVPTRA